MIRRMDAPHQPTDAELIQHAKGMALDTATLFEDCARRLPTIAFSLYRLATELRKTAASMDHAKKTIDAQASHTAGT